MTPPACSRRAADPSFVAEKKSNLRRLKRAETRPEWLRTNNRSPKSLDRSAQDRPPVDETKSSREPGRGLDSQSGGSQPSRMAERQTLAPGERTLCFRSL